MCRAIWPLTLAACSSLYAHTAPVRLFTIADGLPRNFANCLTPGKNGIMWICTSEGLARFDGNQIRVFTVADGLPSTAIYDMTPARGGGYWLVTEKGVCRLEPQSKIGEPCKPWAGGAGVKFRGARVHESSDEKAWLLTSDEVLPIDLIHRTIVTNGPRFKLGVQLNSIADAPGSDLLVAANTGLFRWTPGGSFRLISSKKLAAGVSEIVTIRPGIYWLAAYAGLMLIRLEGELVLEEPLLPQGSPVGIVYRGPSARVWVTSAKTLYQLEAGEKGSARMVEELTEAEGIPKTLGNLLVEDSQGALWGSAGGLGVFRINNTGVRSYYSADGLGNAAIASIFEDQSGKLCVMTTWDGTDLRVFDGNRFHPIAIPYQPGVGHTWGYHQFGLQAHNGEWWFASATGVLRFAAADVDSIPRAKLLARYASETGLPHPEIFRTYEDRAGDIWIASTAESPAISRRDHKTGRFTTYDIASHSAAPPLVLAIRESPKGDFWIGTDMGLYRLQGRQFVPVLEGKGGSAIFNDLLFDREGRLWIASSLRGVLRFDRPEEPNPAYVSYTVAEGLSANSVRALTQDSRGFIYLASVSGLDRIDPHAGPGEHKVRRFTAADGLPNSESTNAYCDLRGRLWLGTNNGLAMFDPSRTPQLARSEPFITGIRVRGEDQPIAWDGASHVELNLPAERNQVEIRYAGTGTTVGSRVQYRLGNTGWSEQPGQWMVNYPDLPYGRSRFDVRIINADGDISTSTASVDLFVLAPLWRRGWFLALAASASVGLGVLIYRARVRQLLAIANLRTHIATDLHDDIGANLTQIAILSEVAMRDGRTSMLKEISGIARDTVAQMSDIVWAISPSHDGFDSLVHRLRRFAEDTLGSAGIEVTFEVTGVNSGGVVPLNIRRPLFLIFKEGIHNAARHSCASHASIAFEIINAKATITVQDDGRGFDVSRVQPTGEGIASIKRRAAQLGGSAIWKSNPGTGTLLVVSIPLDKQP